MNNKKMFLYKLNHSSFKNNYDTLFSIVGVTFNPYSKLRIAGNYHIKNPFFSELYELKNVICPRSLFKHQRIFTDDSTFIESTVSIKSKFDYFIKQKVDHNVPPNIPSAGDYFNVADEKEYFDKFNLNKDIYRFNLNQDIDNHKNTYMYVFSQPSFISKNKPFHRVGITSHPNSIVRIANEYSLDKCKLQFYKLKSTCYVQLFQLSGFYDKERIEELIKIHTDSEAHEATDGIANKYDYLNAAFEIKC